MAMVCRLDTKYFYSGCISVIMVSSNLVNNELNFIYTFVDSHSSHQNEVSYWLGGNDLEMEGTFKWVRSDAPLVFTDWNPGQPDDFSSGEDCIELQGAMDYHWNDLSCSARHRFICESS